MNPSSQPATAQTWRAFYSGMLLLSVSSLSIRSLALIIAAAGVCGYLVFRVGREIFYAANPDKRPVKRRRKK